MNNYQYEFITTLQYRVKNLQAQVDAFKNGSKYRQMDAQYKSLLHTEECRIHKLEVELSNPSMKVDKRFHCFGCQEDGDVIDFVGKLFSLKPLETARKNADDFCITTDDHKELDIL